MALPTLPPGIVAGDFERIEAAVMETTRGRWFLLEYARRQRAVEMQDLLDAITRLEDRLPPRAQALEPEAQDLDPRLAALSRLDRLSPEEKLALFA